MFNGATCSAAAMVGTAVFKMVVSSDSMKNATAINQGNSRLLVSVSEGGTPDEEDEADEDTEEEPDDGPSMGAGELGGLKFGGLGGIVLRGRVQFLQIFSSDAAER